MATDQALLLECEKIVAMELCVELSVILNAASMAEFIVVTQVSIFSNGRPHLVDFEVALFPQSSKHF